MAKKSLEVSPWINIWVKPRNTIAQIVKFDPKYQFILLSALYGFPMLLHICQNFSIGDSLSAWMIAFIALVLCVPIGMLGISVGSALLFWTGKWIGGKGSYLPIRAAVSWSNVTNVVYTAVWFILMLAFKEELFSDALNRMAITNGQQALLLGAFLIQGILSVWSFVILVNCLGEVQKFSAWKGVLNVLIPFFMVGIFIWAVSWVVWMLQGT